MGTVSEIGREMIVGEGQCIAGMSRNENIFKLLSGN